MFGQRDDNGVLDTSGTIGAPLSPPTDINEPIEAASINATPPPPPTPSFSSATLDAPVPSVSPNSVPSAPAVPVHVAASSDLTESTTDELVQMKQEALKHLQPLVGSLQQSPEEEFRTLMMMIQATDDRTMLKKAMEAAKSIKDDKVRAQAMLDVINEINYFTQSGESIE